MLKKLFVPSAPFPTNRAEAIVYAEEMTKGIRLWMDIDIAIFMIALLAWGYNIISAKVFAAATLIALGCAIVMILGYSVGCLRYLTLKECYWIVKIHI